MESENKMTKNFTNVNFQSEYFCPEWQMPFSYFPMHKNISTS